MKSTSSVFHAVTQGLSSRLTRVATVTGASSRIGLEAAQRLIASGYRIVANSRKITSAMTLQSTADVKLVAGNIGLRETAKQEVAIAAGLGQHAAVVTSL